MSNGEESGKTRQEGDGGGAREDDDREGNAE